MIVNIPILNDSSKLLLKKVKIKVIENKQIIKIITDKKYLLISDWFKFLSEKVSLLAKTCLGLAWERSSFKEYLIRFLLKMNLMNPTWF